MEKAPAELRLKQSQPGNIFHNDETPETTFACARTRPGRYELRWEISNVDGTSLAREESKAVELPCVGSEADITVPLTMPDLGWYGLRVTARRCRWACAARGMRPHLRCWARTRDRRAMNRPLAPGGSVASTTRPGIRPVAGPMLFKAGIPSHDDGLDQSHRGGFRAVEVLAQSNPVALPTRGSQGLACRGEARRESHRRVAEALPALPVHRSVSRELRPACVSAGDLWRQVCGRGCRARHARGRTLRAGSEGREIHSREVPAAQDHRGEQRRFTRHDRCDAASRLPS